MQHESILVVDFGGQYNQLIARRVRDLHVYAEVVPYSTALEKIREVQPKGIIFTGGPNSVFDPASPQADPDLYKMGIPVLGICYGAQLIAHQLGGTVETAPVSEYGKTILRKQEESPMMREISGESIVWMSHTDYIAVPPEGFRITADTEHCPVAVMEAPERQIYAVQFHPEVTHSVEGQQILSNFVFGVCGCSGDWQMASFVDASIEKIRETVGEGRALCALSGGVDSSVAAVLMSRAIGKQLTCVFVDHGLLRKNEGDEVEAVFGPEGSYDLNFIRVNAQDRFYEKLKGVTEPEEKRKIIGEEFIRVFEEEAKKIGAVDFLVQGTIYPDVIESGLGKSATIKSHHNVGGLPDYVDFREIIEPLRMLFKDEVRQVGRELGIPEYLVSRQPFPGPGLGIRIVGDVTPEKIRMVQEADWIFREEVAKAVAVWKQKWREAAEDALTSGAALKADRYLRRAESRPEWLPDQYFAALSNMRSVGVMGDFRTYDYAVVLRAVSTSDFMTADAVQFPWELLNQVTGRIINEVRGVNRVLYDCTSKPPGTIELE